MVFRFCLPYFYTNIPFYIRSIKLNKLSFHGGVDESFEVYFFAIWFEPEQFPVTLSLDHGNLTL